MPTYVALLRGINVGGNRIIRMADLVDMVAATGGRGVTTYIQSGNVVFAHTSRSAARLTADLERTIAVATGFDVRVVLRTVAEWTALIRANPFSAARAEELHVSFLATRPPAAALASLDATAYHPERFALVDREIYLHLPGGMGRSKLAIALAKVKPIAPTATARNWRTVMTLHELASTHGR